MHPESKADRAAVLERMRAHITAVVGRYRGRIHAWDVVNEALDEDGTLRRTPWLEAIGDDYIAKAFAFAREADPERGAVLQRLQPVEAGQTRRRDRAGEPPAPGGRPRRWHRGAGALGTDGAADRADRCRDRRPRHRDRRSRRT